MEETQTSSTRKGKKSEPEINEVPLELGVFYRRERDGYRAVIVRMPTHLVNEFTFKRHEPDLLENARARGEGAFNNVISGHDEWLKTEELLSCGECGRSVK